MKELRYTLVSDGSSDRALLPIISWLLMEQGVLCPIQAEWADLGRLRNPPRTLAAKIERSLDLYPCDILFVHRDAERGVDWQSYQQRRNEIIDALANINLAQIPPICVVPVRMMEAWLLINEAALRRAVGNPNGETPLNLPSIANLENIPDPKEVLYLLLRVASELSGRRLRRFEERRSAGLVAEYIDDFGQLRALPAFRALEADIEETVTMNNWAAPL
jgi:hypothetical protein